VAEDAWVVEKREELKGAAQRLRGTWHWVVTNSDAPNAFVTPYCPRRVFVTEGLLTLIKPTDDELAFIMGHEMSHVIHGHGLRRIEFQAYSASLQLVILSMIDPTGIFALGFTMLTSTFLTAEERAFSREHEAEADETGISIVGRACFDPAAGASAMGKLQHAFGNEGKRHASWLDTHPAEADRIRALKGHAENAVGPTTGGADVCGAAKKSFWLAMGR